MRDEYSLPNSGYGAILERVNDRAADAVLGKGRVRSRCLRADLSARLHGQAGGPDAFVADPVFESARVWERADKCLDDLAGGMLEEDLVAALDRETLSDGTRNDRRWPRCGEDVAPYLHQLRAWEAAEAGRSFMVTSGTGSGKTECFMIPMLNDLLRSHKPGDTGVRAIVLYPLNALIDSQKERLGAWMDPLANRLSYALYNRHMSDTVAGPKKRGAQILERRTMRQVPPSLMVTNVTMLEYMLMRAQDRPILEKSQGTLRWIVLDEAHSYVGAQAAEMALLLRRVRDAFGVGPESVRLAATSATIGEGEESRNTLKQFLAALAGLRPDQVEVIEGQERAPVLPSEGPDASLDPVELSSSPDALWQTLAPNPRLRKVRTAMRGGGVNLRTAAHLLGRDGDTGGTLRLLEAAAQAKDPLTGVALAPWRLHVFHRAQGGLWACVNPDCCNRSAVLADDDGDWPFGQIYFSERDTCDGKCGAPVLEIAACDECGTPWLRAEVANHGPYRVLSPARETGVDDDYLLDVEPDEDGGEPATPVLSESVLVGPGAWGDGDFLRLSDAQLFEIPNDGDHVVPLNIRAEAERGCCERAGHKSVKVRPQRFGAPFLMGNAMPLLLEAAKPSRHDHPVPFGGRRLLSFTDSRQGTARFSAKLQQDAERTLTRAIIFHSVQNRAGDPEKAETLRNEITALEQVVSTIPSLAGTLEEKRTALLEAEGAAKPVPWSEMVQRIAQNEEFRNFAWPVWDHRLSKGSDSAALEPKVLAELFLYREMFRRPRLQNNVETMGLARLWFPELDAQARLSVPETMREAGHDENVWSDLLHATVDMVFRANLAIRLPEDPVDIRHWISPRSALRAVVEPGLSREDVSGVGGPSFFPTAISERTRLVQLVYRMIGGSLNSATDVERAGATLTAIWTALRKAGVIVNVASGAWRVDFKKAMIAPIETAFECPVTRRLLPYAPGGVSLNAVIATEHARAITMPTLPEAAPTGTSVAQRETLRAWLESDPNIATLRLDGHWTNLHDRTAEFTPFLRAQEHSAQIDRNSLKNYENAFRQGRINVLNCSTTMEMGVDIPDVGVVVNTNVPPSPANYRQRIGRAGRRGEPWAMAFTFCKDLPLDNMIFRDPARLLGAQVAAPQVRLDSAILVQRHVNAALLGQFLREGGGASVNTNMASFMGATGEIDTPLLPDSMADDFLAALQGDWGAQDHVTQALDGLVTGTCLAGHIGLVSRTEDDFAQMRNRWREEYEQLVNAQAAYPENDPAHWLYRKRAERMRNEFMMTELARRGFTPSYGFPVDVVSFDHIGKGSGEPGPSRPLDMAIREYSPGCEVVIDGLVHRSDGVLPTWGNRNDPSAVEDLRTLFTCQSCNMFGATRHEVAECPRCGSQITRTELLRPSGFLGTRKPHSAYEQLAYVAPDAPRVSAEPEDWVSLPDPEVGRHRTARAGRVLVTASGENGCGYAVCITCGRAEAETGNDDPPLPSGMVGHRPLQKLRDNPRHDGLCPANDDSSRKIRRQVKLGTEMVTDVFELQLDALPDSDTGKAQAAAIGAALREALGARLGVDAETMGLAVARSLRPDESRRSAVFLYDKASGGSGFASAADRDLPGLLRAAAARLDCPAGCASGCPECVLRRDLQFGTEMDRVGALEVLTTEILPRLDLPKELRLFGDESSAVTRPVAEWIGRQLARGAIDRLTLFLTDPPSGWDEVEWPGARIAKVAGDAGTPVAIVIRSSDVQRLEMSHKLDLLRLVTKAQASLHLTNVLPKAGDAAILAEARIEGKEVAIASPDEQAGHVDRHWGDVTRAPAVYGPCVPHEVSPALSLEKVTVYGEGNSSQKDVTTELDGPVMNFGQRFWSIARSLRPQVFAGSSRLTKVTYNDRYMRSPFTVRLLYEVWRTLPLRVEDTALEIISEALGAPDRPGYLLWHNWETDALRREILSALFPGASVKLGTKSVCVHERFFLLTFDDGAKVKISLDQGFGAWREGSQKLVRFDHEARPEYQARALRDMRFVVAMQNGGRFPSPITLRW
ncbi:DEAD/DEAH box helicase [Frigidibacter sp. ROC022]|uniref:DEAD/DEAH box helicase n=1 Tax=Frigidibacter sp. ROC022 TaxID=2971796 RepID=UPI00215A1E99|nr:DEAD/DEAH box helicase [Frigidibacter sp. ROC022]MCR8726472.1 DEAD/DEAH box helicase [Frigidibacter sp. ROC022]